MFVFPYFYRTNTDHAIFSIVCTRGTASFYFQRS